MGIISFGLGLGLILLILITFVVPASCYYHYGTWTYNLLEARAYDIKQKSEELDCYWGKSNEGLNSYWKCEEAPCKTYNIDGKDCIREGMTGGIMDTSIYYICKDYGRVQRSCIDWYDTKEEYYGES